MSDQELPGVCKSLLGIMSPVMLHRSYWLQEVLRTDTQISESLNQELRCDIGIIGGGYVGLWTAIQIKRLEPQANVVILEKDICGGGASGRNGGFILSWWPKISSLVKLCGSAEGLQVAKDSEAAIQEIGDFLKERSIEADFRRKGWLWTATSKAQMNAWDSVVDVCDRLGVDVFQRLEPKDVAARSGSSAHRAGVLDKTAATVQPATLVRALRTEALKLGVKIFESSAVMTFDRKSPVRVTTAGGSLICQKLIIANNAWAASIPELSRSIVAITSDMIVTAPAEKEIHEMGWTGGECITDSQTMVDYYHVTKEKRVAFGKGGWGIAYGGNLGSDFDRNETRAKMVEADLRRYYPKLKNIAVTHDWCGPIDRTPNSLPLLGHFTKHPHIIYGVGWSGNGVGPSVIGGKILASLALGRKDRWGSYPLVEKSVGKFPPEPIRYWGAHIVRSAVAAKERAEIDDQKPSWLSVQLASLAPKGLEDKE